MRHRLLTAVLSAGVSATLACAPEAPTGVRTASSGPPVAARQGERTVHRPITEFLAGQGTYCPGAPCASTPFPRIVNWVDPESGRIGISDYAGFGAARVREVSGGAIDIPTRFEGTVTERVRPDGRTEVHVLLRASDVLAFAFDNASGSLLFGNRTGAVRGGAEPALGDAHLQVKYVTTAPPGAPMPDLVQLIDAPAPGQELLQLNFHAMATGTLHSAFGVPEGTRGRFMIQETASRNTMPPRVAGDAWPVNFIKLQVLGGR